MKKLVLLLLFCSGALFALTDTDADGVPDQVDVCPHVYARSTTGCPTLVAATLPDVNSCLSEQLKQGKIIATVVPSCNRDSTICTVISRVVGFQSCDPIFPVIFDKNGVPLIRGSVYIVDYTN